MEKAVPELTRTTDGPGHQDEESAPCSCNKDLTTQNESCERETEFPRYPIRNRSLVSFKMWLCLPTTSLLYRKDCPLFLCYTVGSVSHITGSEALRWVSCAQTHQKSPNEMKTESCALIQDHLSVCSTEVLVLVLEKSFIWSCLFFPQLCLWLNSGCKHRERVHLALEFSLCLEPWWGASHSEMQGKCSTLEISKLA